MIKKLTLASFITLTATWTLACCMVPVTYKGSISQDAQEAVLIHEGDREELILRINYRIAGDKMPDNFAWVITTPQEPDSYALADTKLFKDMLDLSEKLLVKKQRTWGFIESANKSITDGVELGKHVQVGPYDIQPIRGVGPDALKGLNTWLSNHGFPTESPDHMTYFVENNFTFLCVRIIPDNKNQKVEASGLLPPLHLSFRTSTPYYPLRFSSRQGVFDVNLHILTRNKLDYKANKATLAKLNWKSQNYRENVKISNKIMPNTLKQLFNKSLLNNKAGNWHYNNLRCFHVNSSNTISKWKEDIFFSTK